MQIADGRFGGSRKTWRHRVERFLARLSSVWLDFYFEVRNRYFAKYYLLDIKAVPRGRWMDADYRMFHAVFQILVDFVEQEEAQLSKIWLSHTEDDEDILAWSRASLWNRWRNRQSWNERLGMAHLKWASALGDSSEENPNASQAEYARKTLALYKWYKWERPLRDEALEKLEFVGARYVNEADEPTIAPWDWTPDHAAQPSRYSDEYGRWLDQAYTPAHDGAEEEDTRKAQELIEIRGGLWT